MPHPRHLLLTVNQKCTGFDSSLLGLGSDDNAVCDVFAAFGVVLDLDHVTGLELL